MQHRRRCAWSCGCPTCFALHVVCPPVGPVARSNRLYHLRHRRLAAHSNRLCYMRHRRPANLLLFATPQAIYPLPLRRLLGTHLASSAAKEDPLLAEELRAVSGLDMATFIRQSDEARRYSLPEFCATFNRPVSAAAPRSKCICCCGRHCNSRYLTLGADTAGTAFN